MNVDVVLDTSALRAYARLETFDLGELITAIAENGGAVGVPATVFTEVYGQVEGDGRRRLARLLDDDAYPVILPMSIDDLLEVADLGLRLPVPLAHAIARTRRHGASLATFDPEAVRGDLDEYDILDLN